MKNTFIHDDSPIFKAFMKTYPFEDLLSKLM